MGYSNVLYLILFSSLHELGHIAALYLLGGKADEITVSYYGIGLKHSSSFSNAKEFVFLLSGIVVNVFFCAIKIQFKLNLALAFINALPLYPLDGGRILKVLVTSVFSCSISDKIMLGFSALFICLLIAAGIAFKNVSFILISLYIIFYSINSKRLI